MAAIVRPRFYPVIALILALLVFIGFSRSFYLSFLFDVPPLTRLLILHGVAFSAWVVLFVVQARLIAANRVRTHMTLGLFGAGLAAVVFALGVTATLASISVVRPRPLGLNGVQFAIVPFTSIALFGALVATAVAMRRRPAVHKRLMTLAMIAVISPPVARIIGMMSAQAYFLAIQVGITAALVITCVAYDWLKHRVLHPVYLFGGALLILSWPLRIWVAHMPAWESFARGFM